MDTKELLIELLKWDYLNDVSGYNAAYQRRLAKAFEEVKDAMVTQLIDDDIMGGGDK